MEGKQDEKQSDPDVHRDDGQQTGGLTIRADKANELRLSHGERIVAEREHAAAAEEAKTRKKAMEAAQGRERMLWGEILGERQEMPLFDKGDEGPSEEMGLLGPTTRIGRRFVLTDTENRVEFQGFEADGSVKMVWVEGDYAGESMFPAGPVSVEQWNAEWAPKVEGYSDRTGADPDDDSWRAVLLEDLADPALKPGVLKNLAENNPPIVTIGDLTDWQEHKGDFWHKDIPGLGKAAADNIADATEAFWERRNKG